MKNIDLYLKKIEDSLKKNLEKQKDCDKKTNNFFSTKEFLSTYKENDNFVIVDEFDFEKSDEFVFFGQDRQEHGMQKEEHFKGLKKQQVLITENKVVYLIDNHNKALKAFLDMFEKFGKFSLVHIDAHRDDAKFTYPYPEKICYENLNEYIEKTRVSDYIDLFAKTNTFKDIFNITQSFDFEGLELKNKKDNFLLNLDIDIFGPEGEVVDLDLKIQKIIHSWKKSKIVVLALSPSYINHDLACGIVKILVSSLGK